MFTSIGTSSTPTGTPALRDTPGTEPGQGRGVSSQPHSGARSSPAGVGWGSLWRWGLTRHVPSEPGYYRDGEFGIRIEDVALVVEAQTEVGPWGWGDRGAHCTERGGETPRG